MRKPDYVIRNRLIEELSKVFPDHINLAHVCGVSVRQARDWWNLECTPSATNLNMLDGHGIDIYYVITGKRAVKSDV